MTFSSAGTSTLFFVSIPGGWNSPFLFQTLCVISEQTQSLWKKRFLSLRKQVLVPASSVGSHCTAHRGLWARLCFQISKGGWDTLVSSDTLPSPSFPQLPHSPSYPKHTKTTMPRGEQSPTTPSASKRAFPRHLLALKVGDCLLRILLTVISRITPGPCLWPHPSPA